MDGRELIGQVIDGKYQMERELGRGGMGTVYLAHHLGTDRPVAVKIIAPQFMERAEFVERFRREARAAGRLRHPNVVDVTDFGFSETSQGQVAYLVMEYLDGCTLGEILDEEKNLPVAWTLDILDQVCSAVQEAHDQGIIHRDLKPDNIWLEPNQRGGYTVKVLDFGIAKLEEDTASSTLPVSDEFRHSELTIAAAPRMTLAAPLSSTLISEASTIAAADGTHAGDGGSIGLAPLNLEDKTAIYQPADINGDQDTVGTQVFAGESRRSMPSGRTTPIKTLLDTPATASLTRVGAVLGTPLYMSPEQCRGDSLDARSDIYSLGVIAYQMLSGRTPFEGDLKDVMAAHREKPVPPLVAKKVRKKMRRAIYKALEKDPDDRPQSAGAFASEMRARADGIFGLLRRASTIYTEHLPKFLLITALFEVPMIFFTLMQVFFSFLRVSNVIPEPLGTLLVGLSVVLLSIVSGFCTIFIIGATVWVVAQYLLVPLRPLLIRPALHAVKLKWKQMAIAGIIVAVGPIIAAVIGAAAVFAVVGGVLGLLSMAFDVDLMAMIIGLIAGSIAGVVLFVVLGVKVMLASALIMMEGVSIRQSITRSWQLTSRALATSIAASLIMMLMPMIMASGVSYVVDVSAKAFDPTPKPVAVEKRSDSEITKAAEPAVGDNEGVTFTFGKRPAAKIVEKEMDMQTRVKRTLLDSLIQLIWLPLQILVLSFSAIMIGLLYLKTRLAGGEALYDLLDRFEDDRTPRKKWQERVRQRLVQSGRISGRSESSVTK